MIKVDLIQYAAGSQKTKDIQTELKFLPRVSEWLHIDEADDDIERGYYEVIGVSYFQGSGDIPPTVYLKSLGDDFDAEEELRTKHGLKDYVDNVDVVIG